MCKACLILERPLAGIAIGRGILRHHHRQRAERDDRRHANRRDAIEALLPNYAAQFIITGPNNGNNFTTTSATVVLTGNAPIEVVQIGVVSGQATVSVPLTWPTATTWSVTLALQPGVVNSISIQGRDRNGAFMPGYIDSISITRQ